MKIFIIFVAGLLVHYVSAALECEKKMMRKCAHEYKLAVRAGEEHCQRLQTMITCLANNDASCSDVTITSFRVWMLQMGLMDKIMGICPGLEKIDNLRSLTPQISALDLSVESDHSPPPCAITIHNRCVQHYMKTLRQTHQICTAVEALNKCYSKGSTLDNCRADIIQHFAAVVKKVAPRVINVLKVNLPKVCSDWV